MKLLKLICLFLAISLLSCTKQGEMGPDGKNGNAVLNGQSDPTNLVGNEGDFYLNLTSKKLFGPKTNTGWGQGVDLNGKDGNNGNNGNTILSGVAAPTISVGNNGDFYINLSYMDFYGPKTDAGWGIATSLKSNSEEKSSVSYVTNILSTSWNKINSNTFLLVLDFPEIDSDLFKNGNIGLSVMSNGKTNYEIIPGYFDWFTYSANYSIGKIEITATFEGKEDSAPSPNISKLKVVLTNVKGNNRN